MRFVSFLAVCLLICSHAGAQITISSSDMPVSGDTLRYSFANITGTGFNAADSGASRTWNYTLTPLRQTIDTYKTASMVNIVYAFTIGTSAFGVKVGNTLPGLDSFTTITVSDVYNFYQQRSSPSSYIVKSFAANISGLPTAINYTTPDAWYFFPLTYGRNDSAQFLLNFSIPGFGGIKQAGYRKSRVDGWGSITTPYFTTPVNCIRVRQEIHEIDSVSISTGGLSIGIPRTTVEYRFLVNGSHYPALWVTANVLGGLEVVSRITYRDSARLLPGVGVAGIQQQPTEIKAFPNPSANGHFQFSFPASWNQVAVEVFDLQGRQVTATYNTTMANLSALPSGRYIARISCGTEFGYVVLER